MKIMINLTKLKNLGFAWFCGSFLGTFMYILVAWYIAVMDDFDLSKDIIGYVVWFSWIIIMTVMIYNTVELED